MESLRLLMSHLGHDEEMDSYRDEMARKIRESLIYKDLEEIGSHMEDLIRKLEERPSYGNCSEDARKNLENFERFEKVVEVREGVDLLGLVQGIEFLGKGGIGKQFIIITKPVDRLDRKEMPMGMKPKFY